MTKLGQQMIAGLKEAVTIKSLLDENKALRAENKKLRERLDDIWQGLQTVCGDVRAAIRESGE